MADIARDAMQAGALGFSTSRTLNHRTSDGQPTPTLTASEAELTGIAMGLAEAGQGALQFVSDFADGDAEFGMMRRLVEASGRPLSFSLVQSRAQPDQWRSLLDHLGRATADGLPMKAQVCGRAVGILFGLELTLNPFSQHETYKEIAQELDLTEYHMENCAAIVRLMEAAGLTEPYRRLTEKPDHVPQWCSKHWLKAGERKGGGKRRKGA
jgi:N-acyl-D-aspartate/D-glutamate deacylase